MIRLFTGFDQREAVGWHAFAQSVIENASEPVALIPIGAKMDLNLMRDGSNAFTYARFGIPYLCDFEGSAIFVDGADMIAREDIAELWKLRDPRFAVQVVKHDYATKFPRKYLGTPMECDNRDYPRKNWSSVIIWNCAHPRNKILYPEFIHEATGEYLHRFSWLNDDEISELPSLWNWLADEYGPEPGAKLLHFTAGVPSIPAHNAVAHAGDWMRAHARSLQSP